jgi:hypothetical protein
MEICTFSEKHRGDKFIAITKFFAEHGMSEHLAAVKGSKQQNRQSEIFFDPPYFFQAFLALNDKFSKKVRVLAGKVLTWDGLLNKARQSWAMEQLNISRERSLAALAAHKATTRLLCTATQDVRVARNKQTVLSKEKRVLSKEKQVLSQEKQVLSQDKLLLEAQNDILELPGVVETIKDVLYPKMLKTKVSYDQMTRVWKVVAILKTAGVRGKSLTKPGPPLPVSGNPTRLVFVNDGAYRLAIRITQAFDRRQLPTSGKKYFFRKK